MGLKDFLNFMAGSDNAQVQPQQTEANNNPVTAEGRDDPASSLDENAAAQDVKEGEDENPLALSSTANDSLAHLDEGEVAQWLDQKMHEIEEATRREIEEFEQRIKEFEEKKLEQAHQQEEHIRHEAEQKMAAIREAKRRAEEERKRRIEEARKKAEEERRRREEERRRKEEEERQRKEEEERRRREEEERRRMQEEQKRREEEARLRAEEERKRKEEEEAREAHRKSQIANGESAPSLGAREGGGGLEEEDEEAISEQRIASSEEEGGEEEEEKKEAEAAPGGSSFLEKLGKVGVRVDAEVAAEGSSEQMRSFMKKVKRKDTTTAPQGGEEEQKKKSGPPGTENILNVDIYRTDAEFIIFAQMPGVSAEDLEIMADKELDTVVIKGEKKRPDEKYRKVEGEKEEKGKFIIEDVAWGPLYRKIVLPEEVDVYSSVARLEHGVLVLRLPLLRAKGDEGELRKIRVFEDEEE